MSCKFSPKQAFCKVADLNASKYFVPTRLFVFKGFEWNISLILWLGCYIMQ